MAAGAYAVVTPTSRPEYVRDLLRELASEHRSERAVLSVVPDTTTFPRPRLSEQERRALVLYVSGAKLAAVAHQLGLRYDTAKSYLDRVRAKYDRAGRPARTKLDLYHRAVEDGLV
jgi:DNA-binding CsgD family transcriptional regulator